MFQKFMSNTKVETSVMSDLGMDKVTKKFKDPRPKMEQRHQIVSYLFAMATDQLYPWFILLLQYSNN